MSAALVVVVYEGGVRVANADGGGEIAVVAGEAATVSDQGEVTQIDGAPAFVAATDPATATATATATDPATATATDPATATAAGPADVLALRNEVGRLRGLLERNAISPETGAPAGPGERRRGLNDDGDTDLTEDEWRALAERGELRYRIPGNAQGAIRPPVVQAHRLTGDEVTRLSTIVRDAHERLHREMSLLFREAVGSDPQGMSMSAMMMEIGDKTEEQAASRIRWVLSQERAGLMAPPTVTPDMLPYERMIRLLVAFEGELEAALAAVVGPETAHSIVHGDNAMPAHAYGAVGRRNGG
jgi:hypothetical protein